MSFVPSGFDRDRVGLWIAFVGLLVGALLVAWQYVGTLILGVFAYYVARPVFERLQRRLPSRTLAVAVTLVLVALPVLLLVGWTAVVAAQRLSVLLGSETVGQFGTALEPYLDSVDSIEQLTASARAILDDPERLRGANQSLMTLLETAVASLLSALLALLHLFIALVVAFYLLRDDHRIAAWARETAITPGGIVDSYLVAVDSDLKSVFFGNILTALLTAFLGVLSYGLLNLFAPPLVRIPDPVLLGLLSGVASLVPVIGIKLVWVPIGLYLTGNAVLTDPATLWFVALFAGVSVVVVDTIPDQLLRPYVSGRTLHVGAVILAYSLGPLLFGWYGIFLGPFLLVVGVEFLRHIFPWLVDPDATPPSRPPEPAFAADEPAEPGTATDDADSDTPDGDEQLAEPESVSGDGSTNQDDTGTGS